MAADERPGQHYSRRAATGQIADHCTVFAQGQLLPSPVVTELATNGVRRAARLQCPCLACVLIMCCVHSAGLVAGMAQSGAQDPNFPYVHLWVRVKEASCSDRFCRLQVERRWCVSDTLSWEFRCLWESTLWSQRQNPKGDGLVIGCTEEGALFVDPLT